MPGESPLVSVILPVCNAERFIGATIESALSQTYRNIELIIIDDGSTDATPGIIEEQAARDPRVKMIRQANSGVARARNRGLAAARGEFVAPLDADDVWDPSKIERQVRRMIEAGDETGFVYCWWVWIDVNGTVLDRSPRWQVEGDGLQMLLQVNYTGSASVPLYRRRSLEQVGGYDERLRDQSAEGCEDWDVALRVAERFRVAVVTELLVGYRRRPDSMCTSCDVMWRSREIVTRGLWQRAPDLDPVLFRRSADQFALYLGGVSFWAGAPFRSIAWALRAWRTGLLFRVLPCVPKVLSRRFRPGEACVVTPGAHLDECGIPEPLIPYDAIYGRLARQDREKAAHPSFGDAVDRALRNRPLQALAVIVAFLLVAALNANNDGLWFRGDAARHAANGFLWWDLLRALPADPVDYAARYYARYPVIAPGVYPPLFYIFEGFAFRLLGATPHAARLVVLVFAGLAGIYTMLWARRWVGPRAGWAGAFLAFTPGVVLWSSAVMLNMPAAALGLACLYHFRRWMESSARKQLVTTALFVTAVLLTYYPGGIALAVCTGWVILVCPRLRLSRAALLWALAAIAIAAVTALLSMSVAPVHSARNLPNTVFLTNAKTWTYYPKALPEVAGPILLVLGAAGAVIGLLAKRWRTEALFAVTWITTVVLVSSLLPARDSRYILLVAPAFVIAAAIGLASLAALRRLRPEWQAVMLLAALSAGFWSATLVRVPNVSGYRELAEYMRQRAPAEAVIYDGCHNGAFSFYVRALDSGFKRRVVRGDKLLYQDGPASSFFDWVTASKINSSSDVVEILKSRSGSRWLAIEAGGCSERLAPQRLLRETVRRPEFELVRSFPIETGSAVRVDVYRFREPVAPVTTVDLNFPSFNNRAFRHVRPITR